MRSLVLGRKSDKYANWIPLLGSLLAMCASLLGAAAHAEDSGDSRKVVIPFDFVSKFDEGRYGEMVTDGIWKKLTRQDGVFIVPESMYDVRDTCKANNRVPTPDMSLDKIKPIVVDDFGAQIGIWGSVERAPGTEGEIYDIVIKCVDFSIKPDPKVIYEVKARTNSVSEIPHLYVKEMLDALYERTPGGAAGPDAIAEDNWEKNPNLVVGGDLESAVRGVPKGWEAFAGQKHEALGGLVAWTTEEGKSSNHVMRFTLDRGVAEDTGVMYYSKKFPIEANAKYRFQIRYRSSGPVGKIFIKCYDEINTEYRAGQAKTAAKTKKDYIPEEGQVREVYRSQQNLKGPVGQWNVQTEDFTPKHTKYTPRWCSVMLYAYLQPGTMEWDDVVIKQIVPVSPGEDTKEKRHSLDTKVSVKEMEENERRSNEAKDKTKAKNDRSKPRKP